MQRFPLRVAGVFAMGIVAFACGSSGDGSVFDPKPTDDGSSGTAADNTLASAPLGSSGGSSSGDPDALKACATEQKKATPLPLDLYLMLDTSGSMSAQVAQGVSKYKAVSDAISAFVADKGSEGIGIGMSFFPTNAAGVPTSCTANTQCGANGPCAFKVCNQSGTLTWCDSGSECKPGVACIPLGRCANDTNALCVPGFACDADANGFDRGTCVTMTSSVCGGAAVDSCTAADYAAPQVAIATLPAGTSAVQAALAAKGPNGSTPTSAALSGAISTASDYATAHPGHTVIALLATDGLPTECDTDVGHISTTAGAALAANPSVKTFVIGVFAQNEATTAQANLDQIAAAGGTTKAFIVTQGSTTTQQFVDAMNQIRGDALPCEYNVPEPTSGTPDYDKMNVQHTSPNGAKELYTNRPNAGACDASGGWYYDVDPKVSTPKKIVLCPTTCSAVKAAGGQVDVVIGCTTRVN